MTDIEVNNINDRIKNNRIKKEEVKLKIIREELVEIKTKYNDERRTEIAETDEGDLLIEDLIMNMEDFLVQEINSLNLMIIVF